MTAAVESGARTIDTVVYADSGEALRDLRNGRVNGILTIPPEFSRRVLAKNEPRVALIEDNTDSFVSIALASTINSLLSSYSASVKVEPRVHADPRLDVVEVYPYVPYVQYLLPGSVVMSIFMMVMIGGGIIFIDDKARGLHEGYLVTPITKLELIAGFNLAGTIKAVLAGTVLLIIGSLIAGIPDPFAPLRLLRLFLVIVVTSFSVISLMFLLMVRVNDPLIPRAVSGLLNTVLYFPSGAVYPQQGFRSGCRSSPRSIPSPTRSMRSSACCSRTPGSPRSLRISSFCSPSRSSRWGLRRCCSNGRCEPPPPSPPPRVPPTRHPERERGATAQNEDVR